MNVEFTCEVINRTDLAYLLNDGDSEEWIPKSQMSNENIFYKDGVEYIDFEIPEWLAKEKGLV